MAYETQEEQQAWRKQVTEAALALGESNHPEQMVEIITISFGQDSVFDGETRFAVEIKGRVVTGRLGDCLIRSKFVKEVEAK